MRELRPYQRIITRRVLDTPRVNVFAGMGMGKTSALLHAVDMLSVLGDPGDLPVLVLAPKHVASYTWPEELPRWPAMDGMRISPVVGTAEQRTAALRQPAEIYTVGYDNLPWLVDLFGDRWPFRTVIADEATKLKNFRPGGGTVRARAIGKHAHKSIRRWINLTGTPAANGLHDLWGMQYFIDAGRSLGTSFDAFQQRYFKYVQTGELAHERRLVPMSYAQEQIHDAITPTTLVIDPRDWFDLREPINNRIAVPLPPKARALYRSMEKQMFTEISGRVVTADTAAAKTMKCLQLANGMLYVDEDATEWEVVHDGKLDALASVVEEAAGMPVLVAVQFKPDRARILQRFAGAVDLSKPAGMAAFKAGNASIGIAHPASLGHGVDGLQHVTNQIAFFGHWWNLEERLQMIDRIGPVRQAQAGYNRAVFIHDIVADNTVDDLVLLRHATKRSVMDILLAAMKERA